MTLAQVLLIVIVMIPLALAILNRLRLDVAALLIAALLGLAQFLGVGIIAQAGAPKEAVRAISGFGQPVVITLVCLFIITSALERTGLTRWLVQYLLKAGAGSEARLITLFAATSALLSLFMNNLAAGALLLPGAMEAARRTGIRPSKLLIPVAYGTLLGGAATYFTTANIIVSDLLRIAQPPQLPLRILDFTPTGGIIAVAGIAFFALFGKRLLPDRVPPADQMLTRPTGSQLEDLYQLGERLWELRVLPNSPMHEKSLAETGVGEKLGLTIVGVIRQGEAFFNLTPEFVIRGGDLLLTVGREDRVILMKEEGVTIAQEVTNQHVSPRGIFLAEVILSPHSKALGKTLKEMNFRKVYGATAVALWRKNRSYRTNVGDFALEVGDSLLVMGTRQQFLQVSRDPDFILLEASLSDQPVMRKQGFLAMGVVIAAIILSIVGLPVYLAMLLGVLALLLTRIINMQEAYRSIEWQAVFLVAGMYAVSLAMVQTGSAARLGELVVGVAQPAGPLALAAVAYLFTALLTQVIGGQVAALVTGPIVINAAIAMQVSPQAVAVATAIGCSVSFLTPFAHPVNILMIAPANYHFGDFFRIGWRLTLICFFMLLVGMKLFWGL